MSQPAQTAAGVKDRTAALLEREKKLEWQSAELGRKQWMKNLSKKHFESGPLRTLLRRYTQPLTDAIAREQARKQGPGGSWEHLKVINCLGAEVLGYLTVCCLADRLLQHRDVADGEPDASWVAVPLLWTARELAETLGDECFFRWLWENHPKAWWGFKISRKGRDFRERVKRLRERFGADGGPSEKSLLHLSFFLIHRAEQIRFVKSSTRYKGVREAISSGDSTHRWFANPYKAIEISPKARELLAHLERLSPPKHAPMVVAPARWTGPGNGGYLVRRLELVKHKGDPIVIAKVGEARLDQVCAAVNALQETGWRINRSIYKVLRQMVETGLPIPTQPEKLRPPPYIPSSEAKKKEIKLRCELLTAIRRHNYQVSVFPNYVRDRLRIAGALLQYDGIYFPWQLDYRGRAYPVPQVFNPQSDDIGRSLIEFSEGKALRKRGAFWLAVHLANMFGHGYDKKPLDARVKWTQENQRMILECAKHPYKPNALWRDAKKPWRFLAACFEWAGYTEKGEAFQSRVPVTVDGTCNGLQHLSALICDHRTGRYVNLDRASCPQDFYSFIAARLVRRIQREKKEYRELARRWIERGVKRDVVKYGTMNHPYGISTGSIARHLFLDGHTKDVKEAVYLAGKLRRCVRDEVGRAGTAMLWLREIAEKLARADEGVSWVNPAGFPVVHENRHYRVRQIRSKLYGTFVDYDKKSPKELDVTKQVNGIVANLIHSFDAAHMMLTVIRLRRGKIKDFAMVHDGYGVHACHVDRLQKVLREEFVRMYSQDRLRRFWRTQDRKAPRLRLRRPPERGRLVIRAVLAAEYFFS